VEVACFIRARAYVENRQLDRRAENAIPTFENAFRKSMTVVDGIRRGRRPEGTETKKMSSQQQQRRP